jgi:hypothetical protein
MFIADDQGRVNIATRAGSQIEHLETVQAEAGRPCRILAEHRGDEGDLHAIRGRLERQYVVGNWFRLDGETEAVIRAVRVLPAIEAVERVIRRELCTAQPAEILTIMAGRLCQAAGELIGKPGEVRIALEAVTAG